MALGLSPVEELKKKVELLSSKLESLPTSETLVQKIEELEDMQLLEKLNSIEMREEIQNIRGEIEGVGLIKPDSSMATQSRSELESRLQDIESRLAELSGQPVQHVQEPAEEQAEQSETPKVDAGEIEQSLLKKLDDKIKSLKPGEPAVQQIDTQELEKKILEKVEEKVRSLKPSILSRFGKVDLTDLKINVKSELLADLRTMVDQELTEKMHDLPTAGVSKSELRSKLSQLKTDIIESIDVERVVEKKIAPALKQMENLETRFEKTDSQLTTLYSTLPREIKLVKDDFNLRLESHDKTLDQLRRELKEVRLGGIEGYQYLATKEDVRRVAEEKMNQLRNDIIATKLADGDGKYEELMNRMMGLDDRLSVFKAEVLPSIERMEELDRLSLKLADLEDHVNNFIHERIKSVDPTLIATLVATVDQLKNRLNELEHEPSEYVKRSLDALKMMQDRDREMGEKIAKFVHLETERMATLNEDIKMTVMSRLEDFERRLPPSDVWVEIEALRSRLAMIERSQREMTISVKKKVTAQPAIIE